MRGAHRVGLGGRAAAATVVAAAALLALLPRSTPAQERLYHTFGQDHGLTSAPVWALGQDSVGFLWVGAEGGLFRFDGTEMTRWAPDAITGFVMDLAVSPSGDVAAMDGRGRVYRITPGGAAELDLPWPRQDAPRRPGRMLAFDRAGGLWVHYAGAVGHRGPDGWKVFEAPEAFDGELPHSLVPAGYGGAFVMTDQALWRVRAEGPPHRLHEVDGALGERLVGAVEAVPGRVAVLTNVAQTLSPRVVDVAGSTVHELAPLGELPEARAITLVSRGGTVWVTTDAYMAALRPGRPAELFGPDEGYESGGPLLVDREGGVWLGSFVGLHHFPEPDTRLWTERHGLPSRHTRFVARTGDALWIMTWSGAAMMSLRPGAPARPTFEWDSRSRICVASDGAAWTSSETSILEIRGTRVERHPGPAGALGCTPHRRGGMWFAGDATLGYVEPGTGIFTEVEPPFADSTWDVRTVVLHDRSDRLWAGAGEHLCHADAGLLMSEGQASWRCAAIGTRSGVLAAVEFDDGRVWAAAGPEGLYEWHDGRWRRLEIEGVGARTVYSLRRSPRGGVWVLGAAMLLRARPGADHGVEILERLSGWHGLASVAASDLWEDGDGSLWLATDRGLAHVPAPVRFGPATLPSVALVEGRVDDEPVPLGEALVLPHDRNRIELRFAALAFRHRPGLRHQVRLSPDEPWSESAGEPSFRWVDLPAGTYRAEYRVSRDGVRWSEAPAAFDFRVEPPWYATVWFLLLSGSAAIGLAALIYRARVAHLLELERQRTRIATDLHDQVGSGLASVGILSGVMATDGLSSAERRRTAREIATVAEELGHSLSDIVWTLDPRTASLEELGARLVEHGERLFADGAARFTAELPGRWPPVDSTPTVRRAVLLIGLEALHNAARHASAGSVALSLAPRGGRRWELQVADDGVGPGGNGEAEPSHGSGRGLEAMARRGDAIGADLEVRSRPDGGTTVVLRFDPEGRSAGLPARWARRLRTLPRMIMRAPEP